MKITSVEPLPNYRLKLCFADGTRGNVDLSDKVGRGAFAIWSNAGVFEQVSIGDFGQAVWPGDIDLCPDTLYQLATGRLPREISAPQEPAHA